MANNLLQRPYRLKGTQRIPLGIRARKQLAHAIIYRIRPGNGYYGSRQYHQYQDQYAYFVPASINNPQGEPQRIKIRNAVLGWQALPEATKITWRQLAVGKKELTGYNLYVQNYLRNN